MQKPGVADKVTVEHVASNSHAYSKLTEDRHSSDVRALAFSPDSRLLASGDNEGQIKIWDLYTEKVGGYIGDEDAGTAALGKNRGIPVPSGAGVVCMVFDPSGRYLAVSCRDHRVHIFDTQSLLSYVSQMWFKLRQPKQAAAQTLRTLYSPLPAPLRSMAYASTAVLCIQWCAATAEGKSEENNLSWLLAGCEDGTVRARRLRLDRQLDASGAATPKSSFGFNSGEYDTEHVCFVCHSAPVLCLALDRTSPLFATGSADGSLKIWALPDTNHPSHTTIGTCVWMLKPSSTQGQLHALSWSPNGSVLASSFSSSVFSPAAPTLFDSVTERSPPPLAPPIPTPAPQTPTFASVLPPLAAPVLRADKFGVIKKIEKGVREIQAAKQRSDAANQSPQPPPQQAMTVEPTSNCRIEVWDIASQSCLAQMAQEDSICITSLAWSSDCRILASVNHCREEQYPLASSPVEEVPGKKRSSHIKLWGQTRKDGPRCFQAIQPHVSTRCMIAGFAITQRGCCVGFSANNMVGMVNIDQPAGAKRSPPPPPGPSANTLLWQSLRQRQTTPLSPSSSSSSSSSSSTPATVKPPPQVDELLVQCLLFEESVFRQYVALSNRFKRMSAGVMRDEQGKPYAAVTHEEASQFTQFQLSVCLQLDQLTNELTKAIRACEAEKTFYMEIEDHRSSNMAAARQRSAEDKMQTMKKLKGVMTHYVTPLALLFLLDPAAHWSLEQSNALVSAPTAPFLRSSVPLVVSPPASVSIRGVVPPTPIVMEWSCEYCTTINRPTDDLCDACQNPRPDHEKKPNAVARPWFESITSQSSPSVDLFNGLADDNAEIKSPTSSGWAVPEERYEMDNKHNDEPSAGVASLKISEAPTPEDMINQPQTMRM